jgi:hypothetical protein
METVVTVHLRRAHRRTGRPLGRPRVERTVAGLDLKQAKETSIDKAREDPCRLRSDGRKRPRPDLDRRGRPSTWIGKLGGFVSSFTAERLADELQIDLSQVYRWARGDDTPSFERAIAITEVARSAGMNLTLEDLYATDILRVRRRMHSLLPPL